jgi:hypothetical protein
VPHLRFSALRNGIIVTHQIEITFLRHPARPFEMGLQAFAGAFGLFFNVDAEKDFADLGVWSLRGDSIQKPQIELNCA